VIVSVSPSLITGDNRPVSMDSLSLLRQHWCTGVLATLVDPTKTEGRCVSSSSTRLSRPKVIFSTGDLHHRPSRDCTINKISSGLDSLTRSEGISPALPARLVRKDLNQTDRCDRSCFLIPLQDGCLLLQPSKNDGLAWFRLAETWWKKSHHLIMRDCGLIPFGLFQTRPNPKVGG
jgi:hypothetical protein